jgi:ferric-dicitrate binding protein FerR (iron transport regulator)
MYRTIMPSSVPKQKKGKAPVLTLARTAAAACVLLAGIGAWLFFSRRQPDDKVKTIAEKEVAPGFNKAVLTLADGAKITLDSVHTGELTKQDNVAVVNSINGGLMYQTATSYKPQATSKVLYNTLTTPRGGQYQLMLPDGTKVWLNAASSITYPTAFTGDERKVEITGEAYFEVVHDKKKPFRVKTARQVIEDIGTRFNVNAYADEPAQVTTLLEGSVRIGGRVLKPGEQAATTIPGEVIVSRGDPTQAVAWKNGFFDFSDASLQTVMRQLARWYDVEVRYEGSIRERQFNGMIGRTLTLGQVLRGLTAEGIHHRIEKNNQLIITP